MPLENIFSNMQERHDSFGNISQALVDGKSVEEISMEQAVPFSQLVEMLIYFIGRFGLLSYRVYWAVSPAACKVVKEIENRWPALLIDPRNLEMGLLQLDFEGVRKEEILLTSICQNMLKVNAYGLISNIEPALASLIRTELAQGYGREWWRQGVPLEIRKACSAMQEEDPDPSEEKSEYWTISHMALILESRWAIFSKVLPASMTANRKDLGKKLVRMNRLRNRIMHPIKDYELTLEDFNLLEEIWKLVLFDYPSTKVGGPLPERFWLDLTTEEDDSSE